MATTTTTGNWVEKAPVNPDPYPTHGGRDAQVAWYAKDHEIRMGRLAPRPTSVSRSNPPPVGDGLDLPEPLPPLEPYPRDGSDDDKLTWLQRCGVAHIRAGATDDGPALRAIRLEWLEITEAAREHRIDEVTRKNEDLTRKLNHLERLGIDLTAQELLQETKTFIEREVARQVAELETLVTNAASQTTTESRAIELLNATAVLLNGRIGELEQLSPIWCQIHTKQAG